MLVLLTAANAATTTTTAVTSTAKPVSATSLMFQLLIGLVVVLALIWVAARIARGRVGALGTGKRRNAALAVLSRQPLGKGVQIAVVKAGAEMYLVGVTAHQVTRLARYKPDGAEQPESTDDLPPAGVPGSGGAPIAFRLPSSIRALQDKTLRRT